MMIRNYLYSTLLVIIAGITLTVACGGSKADGIPRLTNEQFIQQAANPKSVILDVRTPGEFEDAHLEGAILIDYLETDNFTKQIQTLDKSKNYLLYCRTGRRSLNAAHIMKEKGFKQVSDLRDGISRWKGPTVTPKK
jgi:rhodanese-related sulfurtransferase